MLVTNIRKDGSRLRASTADVPLDRAASRSPVPARAYVIEVPSRGGNTIFPAYAAMITGGHEIAPTVSRQ
jgi:hypothetical protein